MCIIGHFLVVLDALLALNGLDGFGSTDYRLRHRFTDSER